MATSGTSTFNLTVDDIIAEAYEPLGVLTPTGHELKSARRSLNLLFREFSNRNLFAFISEKDSISTVASTATYVLDANALDIMNVTVTVSSTDIELTRYSYSDYAVIPDKTSTGTPSTYYVDKQRDAIVLYLWPVPDAVYTIKFEKKRKIQDVGDYTNTIDVPDQLLPAIISGLTYKLALKKPASAPAWPSFLAEFDRNMNYAMEGDRDRTSTFMYPSMRRR